MSFLLSSGCNSSKLSPLGLDASAVAEVRLLISSIATEMLRLGVLSHLLEAIHLFSQKDKAFSAATTPDEIPAQDVAISNMAHKAKRERAEQRANEELEALATVCAVLVCCF